MSSAPGRRWRNELDSSFSNGDKPPKSGDTKTEPLSAAAERFHSCRWRKAAEDGTPEHCTHRDVLPMAGTAGFVPESWCADCSFYKAKRMPRKKPEETPPSDTWRRW